ncbi:hypothetical protein KY289_007690 [Solanum tuberosum]|nr:hypothetical protein KY289_007690 [Solanum tuberosum]
MKDYFNLSIGEEKIELPFLDSHLLSFTVAHTQTHTVSRDLRLIAKYRYADFNVFEQIIV